MGNKDYGYILVWRSFFRGKFWKERRVFSKAEAWLDLFSSACYMAQEELVGNVTVNLQRGELLASVRFLGERWQWGNAKVHRFLKQLKDDGMINSRIPAGTQATVLTICNYEEYNALPGKVIHHAEQQRNGGGTPEETKLNKGRNKATARTDRERILSICNSFRACAGARVTQEEIEGVYEVFFFKNFVRPAVEVETFVNHYEASGWVRSGGLPVKNKIALAQSWEQKRDCPARFDIRFLAAWEDMYERLKELHKPDVLTLLYDILFVKYNEGQKTVAVACSAALRDLVMENESALVALWSKHNPNFTVQWIIRF